MSDSDIWACYTADGGVTGFLIHEPTAEMREAARQFLAEQRETDPSYMPVVEFPFDEPPADCETVPGKPPLDEWMADRSILTVMNPDGSMKPEEATP